MAKPSIFSKDYENQMRKRKKRISFTILITAIVVIFVSVYMKGMFKSVSKNEVKTKNSITTDKEKAKSTESRKVEATEPQKIKKSEGYDVKLSSGKTVSAVYENKNNDITFKSVSPSDSNILYNISPSGKNIIVFDDKAQSIILVDIKGNKQDVTNMQYTSSSGSVTLKNAQLSSQPSYIWCSSPKFIDNDNIAYISQLPWIGKTTKYVWIENLKDRNHSLVQEIQGEDVKLDGLTDKGLTVIEDGKTVFLKADGSISE